MDVGRKNSGKLLISFAFFLLFGVGIVGVAMATGWSATWEACLRLSLFQIALLLALSFVNYVVRTLRWRLYTQALGVPTTLLQDFRHYFGGFAMTVTPARIGEFIRLRWIWRETGWRPDKTAALVVVDRAADLGAVGLALALSVGIAAKGLAGAWTAAILAILIAILLTRPALVRFGTTQGYRIIGLFPRFFAMIRRAARQLSRLGGIATFLPAMLFGVIGWAAEAYAFYLLLGWMGADLSLPLCFAIFFLAMLTGGATGLPGGVGGAEAAMIAALVLNNVPIEIALPATAVIRLTTLWFAIGLGILMFPLAERAALRPVHSI